MSWGASTNLRRMERKARSLEESSTGLSDGRSVVGGAVGGAVVAVVAAAGLSPPLETRASSLGILESAAAAGGGGAGGALDMGRREVAGWSSSRLSGYLFLSVF